MDGEVEGKLSFGPRGRWALDGADAEPGIFTGAPSSSSARMRFIYGRSSGSAPCLLGNPLRSEQSGEAGNDEVEGRAEGIWKGRLGRRL